MMIQNDFTLTQVNNDMETTNSLNFDTVFVEQNLNRLHDDSSSTPTESNMDDDSPTPFLPEIEIFSFTIKSRDKIIWGNSSFKELSSFINKTYDQVELFWLHQFNTSSNLNSIALKTFFILPALLLQKPSAKSKAKEHSESLNNRRLDMWKNSEFDKLLKEVQYIQRKFKSF